MNPGLRMMGIAALAGAVTACGPAEPPPAAEARPAGTASPEAPATPAQAAAPAPRPTSGYDWHIRIDDEVRVRSAILAYEVPDTDDQPLALQCEEGGGRIFPSISGGPVGLTRITLASGDRSETVAGTTVAENDEPPYFSGGEIAAGGPFFRAFVANGWMRMTADGHTTDMASAPVTRGKDAIEQFWAFCS